MEEHVHLEATSLFSLPNEIVLDHILPRLSGNSLANFDATCHTARALVTAHLRHADDQNDYEHIYTLLQVRMRLARQLNIDDREPSVCTRLVARMLDDDLADEMAARTRVAHNDDYWRTLKNLSPYRDAFYAKHVAPRLGKEADTLYSAYVAAVLHAHTPLAGTIVIDGNSVAAARDRRGTWLLMTHDPDHICTIDVNLESPRNGGLPELLVHPRSDNKSGFDNGNLVRIHQRNSSGVKFEAHTRMYDLANGVRIDSTASFDPYTRRLRSESIEFDHKASLLKIEYANFYHEGVYVYYVQRERTHGLEGDLAPLDMTCLRVKGDIITVEPSFWYATVIYAYRFSIYIVSLPGGNAVAIAEHGGTVVHICHLPLSIIGSRIRVAERRTVANKITSDTDAILAARGTPCEPHSIPFPLFDVDTIERLHANVADVRTLLDGWNISMLVDVQPCFSDAGLV